MQAADRGVALACDLQGRILRVIRDELSTRAAEGLSLPALMAPGSAEKTALFLEQICAHGAAFNWELDLQLQGRASTLSFVGSRQGDQVLVIGARLFDDVFALYEELTRVNNDEVNLLRRAIKENVLVSRQASADLSSMEELTRLNNELVNLQRELAKKNNKLERLNEQKNTFMGMAAHDLRNPIGSVLGYARLLLELELEPQQRRQSLEAICRVAEQMSTLVDDLLDVSVIESGKLELRRGPCSLPALLRRRVDFFELLARNKQIDLAVKIDDPGELQLDPDRMEQVVDNLISNAIKYSPPGARVEVSLRRAGEEVQLVVRDEGPGLSAEDQRRIFGVFQRLSARPTGGEKSTGLGLAITRRIVTAHGGAIEVQSELGRGSSFTVRVPAIVTLASGRGDP